MGAIASPRFEVDTAEEGDGFRIQVREPAGAARDYFVPTGTQQDFSKFFEQLSADLGTRLPDIAEQIERPESAMRWRPLLTENVHPQILVGYGDPAVLKTDSGYVLVATSNDAPDSFPILRSDDLEHWEPSGFVFPEGHAPDWAATGRSVADFWAPEMAAVGDEYWLCFTARQRSNALAIGLARSNQPTGPWADNGGPLITGRPIDTTGLGYDASQPRMSGGVI